VHVIVSPSHSGEKMLGCSTGVNTEEFMRIFKEWGITPKVIESLVIIIEIRDMIPEAAMGIISANEFVVYLSPAAFESQVELNRSVVHELKHVWYQLRFRSPKQLKWEQKECIRMEGKYQHVNFLTRL
jgi:hypothetical protein